jgi:uncharacterized membrane-anchored protein YjiN (DUF445 family)
MEMKDYLNADEKNQIMVFMSILQIMNGNRGINGPKIITVLEDWNKRGNLTKEEHKNLKYAGTYLTKFCMSVYDRLSDKEKIQMDKRLQKFDFRLVDDFTLQKIYREMTDRMVNAVIPREQFFKWCEEIMHVNCNGCTKDWKQCELHEMFEENFVPESTWNKDNCRYAYE